MARFGNRRVIGDNDPVEQEKATKLNALLVADLAAVAVLGGLLGLHTERGG